MKVDTLLSEGLAGSGDRACATESLGGDTLWAGEIGPLPEGP